MNQKTNKKHNLEVIVKHGNRYLSMTRAFCGFHRFKDKAHALLLRGALIAVVSLFVPSSAAVFFLSQGSAQAQTPNTTINFQARILTSTGALVPDGNYNLEFKLYDSIAAGGTAQGVCSLNSSTDDCWWLETRTGGNVVRVVNGYVSVNLGSVTAFGTSIPWSQQMFITMRVGGIGAPVWDATEMTNAGNRMMLNAAPLALVANNLKTADRTSANSDNITIQTGTTTTSGNSGNIAIDAGGAAGTKGTITLGATNASALTLGRAGLTTSNAGALTVTQLLTGNLGLTVTGNTSLSTTAGNTVSIGNTTGLFTLQGTSASTITGSNGGFTTTLGFTTPTANQTYNLPNLAANTYTICTSGNNCSALTGYIQNNTTLQSAASFYIQSAATTNITARLKQFTAQTADILTVEASGSTTALSGIDASGNFYLGSTASLKITGAATASRPATPTEGQVFYDTTTHRLLVYDATGGNTKWQSYRAGSNKIVAAFNSVQADKDSADYVVANAENSAHAGTGTIDGAQVSINAALTAVSGAGGGVVYLLPGTYQIDASISIPNNVTLAGSGPTSLIQFGDFGATSTSIDAFVNTSNGAGAGTNIGIRDLKFDGRSSLNTVGTQNGIVLTNMGSGTGSTAKAGAKIQNIIIANLLTVGVKYITSDNNLFSDSTVIGSSSDNVELTGADDFNIFSNSVFQGSGSTAINMFVTATPNTNNLITNNVIQGNTGNAININTSNYNTIENNSMNANGVGINLVNTSVGNIISYNTITNTTNQGIVSTTASSNMFANNVISDSGGATTNLGIFLIGSSLNTISSNYISDSSCSTSCNAITIDATSNNTYLSNNILTGPTGTAAVINDSNTTTIYAGQNANSGVPVSQTTSLLSKPRANSTLSGTASINGTVNITGTSTNFTTELIVGDRVIINAETRTIATITNNTTATVDTAFSTTIAGQTITRLAPSLLVRDTSGANVVNVNSTGGAIFKNGTNQTNALQVQTSAGVSVLNVDTSAGGVGVTGTLTVSSTSTFNGLAQVNAKLYVNTATTADASAQVLITTGADTNKGLVLQRSTISQTASFFEIQQETGAALLSVNAAGSLLVQATANISNTQANNASLTVNNARSTQSTLVISGATSQSTDIFQLKDSSGNINSLINSTGAQLTLGRVAASGTVTQGTLTLSDGTTDNFGNLLQSATLTASRTITLPNESGTICTTFATGACSATGGGYVQLAPTAAQTDGTTNATININKTGASGNLLQLTVAAAQRFTADFSGNLVASGTYNTNTFTGSALTFGTAATATVQSAAAQALTLTSNNAATWSTSAGALTLQGFAGVTVTTPTAATTNSVTATTGTASAGSSGAVNLNTGIGTTGTGVIALLTGNASAGAAGNMTLDVGTSSAGNGSILIGTATRAQTITIGNTTGGALRVGQNGSTVQIDGTNFDVATTGIVTLAGAQAQDVNTAVTAGAGAALVIQPGTSTGASSNGGATTIKGGDGSGTTTVTGGALTLVAGSATGGAGTRTGGATSLDAGFGGAAGTNGGAVSIGTTNAASIAIGRTGIVTTFSSTILQKSDSATAFNLQDATGAFNNLLFDSSTNHLKVFDHTAPRTAYADIYYSGGTAVFAASTGTTQVGNGTGDVNVLLTNNSEKFNFSHTGTNAISTDTDFVVTRNITGTTNALQGNIAKIEDLSTFTSGSSAPNLLYINQNNSSATGNLILAQTGGATTRFSVTTAGNTLVAGALTVNTGSTTSGGTVNINASSNFASNINTGTSTGAVGIGNSLAGAITLQSAGTISALGSVLAKTTTNSTTAFQVQNAVGAPAFRVDTTPLNTLIANGGAEDVSMANWALKAGTGSVARSATEAYQGNNSAAVTLTSTAIGDGAKYTPSPVLSAISYELSFEIKQTAGTDFSSNIAVGWNNGASDTDCSLVPTLTNKPILSGFGWYRYVCVFTGSAAGHIYWKQTTVPAVARTFYIDNVQLQTGNSTTGGSFYKESSIILGGPITSPLNIEPTSDSTTVFSVKDAFQHNIISVDSTVNVIHLSVLNTVSTQGAELVTSQAFNSANWTTCNGGAGGWTGTATTATHNIGNIITCSAAASNFTISSGVSYIVTYTAASVTTGTVTPSLGGQNAPRTATNGTFSFIVTTTATTALTFTPTTDYNGVISAVSVKQITESDSILNVDNLSSGTNTLQVRSGSSATNSFVGTEAGMFNNGGSYNAAYGYQALRSTVAGTTNSAFGSQALSNNVTGSNNSAFGNTAGYSNISGSDNVSIGFRSNYGSTSGSGNTSVGNYSGYSLISGANNTFLGYNAGKDDTIFTSAYNLQNATAIGYNSQVQTSNSLVLGGQGANAVNVGIGITAPSNTFQVSPVQYSTGTASVTSGAAAVTGVGTTWTSAMIGSTFVFASGRSYVISNVTSTTAITLATNASLTETTSAYRIHYGGFNVTSTATAYLQSTSATAFQILNAAATQLFVADTTNNRIYIGSTTADAVGTTLVLDTKNTSAEPTGVNGSMYYNSALGSFRCYENNSWKNCVSGLTDQDAWWVRSGGGTTTTTAFLPVGVQPPTVTGALTANNATDATLTQVVTGAVAGNTGGFVSATFNAGQRGYSPTCTAIVRTGGALPTGARVFVGLIDNTPANADNTGGTHAGFRYSTTAADTGVSTGWRSTVANAGTNTIGAANIGASANVAISTTYTLKMRVDSANNTIYMSVNGGTEDALSTNIPAAATNMGFAALITTSDTNADTFNFGRFYCEQN